MELEKGSGGASGSSQSLASVAGDRGDQVEPILTKKGGILAPLVPTSSLRMSYEAEVRVIRRQIGSLEEVRLKLGLSARKMCQLLMVDPSSWSRWVRAPSSELQAPPHIWRALQWYMIVQEKIPGLTAEYFVGRSARSIESAPRDSASINQRLQSLQAEVELLRKRWQQVRIAGLLAFTVVLGLGFISLVLQ